MSNSDPAAAYERLRIETAQMFDYNLADLSLTQGLQIDLVSLLRLEVDTMQGQVLAGDTVDLNRLVMAHAMLQKMLPERALVAPAPPPVEGRFGPSHKAKLRELIEKTLLRDDPYETERLADAMRREEAIQAQAAGVPVEAPVAPPSPEPQRAANVIPISDATTRVAVKATGGPYPWPLPR